MFYYITEKYPNDKPFKSLLPIHRVMQKRLGIKNVGLNKLEHHWSEALPLINYFAHLSELKKGE